MFKDTTSSEILLSYTTSEGLEILEFRVPNLAAHSHMGTLTVSNSPFHGSLRKTAKHVTFCDSLIDLDQPHCTKPSQKSLRKTASLKVSFSDLVKSLINGNQCKSTLLKTSVFTSP